MGFRTSYEWDAIYNGLSDNLLCAKVGIPGRRIIMAMEPNYAPDPGDWVRLFAPLPVLWADDDPQVAG